MDFGINKILKNKPVYGVIKSKERFGIGIILSIKGLANLQKMSPYRLSQYWPYYLRVRCRLLPFLLQNDSPAWVSRLQHLNQIYKLV
jgi:hypothetical protein